MITLGSGQNYRSENTVNSNIRALQRILRTRSICWECQFQTAVSDAELQYLVRKIFFPLPVVHSHS